MKNNKENMITLSTKEYYNHKLNLWSAMLNYDNLPKNTWFAVIIGMLYGFIFYIRHLLDVSAFSWKDAIKSGEGIIYAVILALTVKIATDFYTIKIKHKIFKDEKTNKTTKPKTEETE